MAPVARNVIECAKEKTTHNSHNNDVLLKEINVSTKKANNLEI